MWIFLPFNKNVLNTYSVLENTGMNKTETFSALMEFIVQEKEMTINISIK